MVPYDPDPVRRLAALLALCVEEEATDLHLAAGAAPRLRIRGRLEPRDEFGSFSPGEIELAARSMLDDGRWDTLQRDASLDLALSAGDGTRFRVSVYRERRGLAVAARRLRGGFRELHDGALPDGLAKWAALPDGLVLVTGTSGSGRTTTLATLIHMINRQRSLNIVTIEDPIEYVHSNLKSMVHQRELHSSAPDFAGAVRGALHQNADVILVSRMPGLATVRAVLAAAESGRLVFSTLHAGDVAGALEGLVDWFPADEQAPARRRLSRVLRGVAAQRLLPRRRGPGLMPTLEVLDVDREAAQHLREGRFDQLAGKTWRSPGARAKGTVSPSRTAADVGTRATSRPQGPETWA